MKNSGDGRRVQRMERELQQTVASYLLTGFKTPLPGLVTIARVLMPADLRSAKVYVSVLGTEQERADVLERLKERSFEIQNYIAKQLKTRYCPKLAFFPDEATEKVLKIERILHDLAEEKTKSTSETEES